MLSLSKPSPGASRLKKIQRAVPSKISTVSLDDVRFDASREVPPTTVDQAEPSVPLVRVRCRNCRSMYYFKTLEPMRSTCVECGDTLRVKPSAGWLKLIAGVVVLIAVMGGTAAAVALY